MSFKKYSVHWILGLTLVSLACGSLQVGLVTPSADDATNLVDAPQTSQPEVNPPTATIPAPTETPVEDFSHQWMEYRDPVYGYGVALPAHWEVSPTPEEGFDGAMVTRSYDDAFFMAHSTKGWWTDGIVPEGAIKMDFSGLTDNYPELDLASAIHNMFSQSDTTVVLSTEPVVYNGHDAVLVTTASPNNLDETYKSAAFRLADNKILLVTAYWGDAFSSRDVQAILNSFAYQGEPITLPKIEPYPPLSGMSDDSESSHAAEPEVIPSTGTCVPGNLGSVDEAIQLIQYNLEIGNYYPFSYFIGDPFVIGYWRSEGVSIPREQAYQQLTEQYLPSPEKVVIITDEEAYPDLMGMPVENMFGPDVDVAATIYSQGWGENGQGEAILIIARCQEETYASYFWYGMVYAGDGFE